MGSTRWQGYVSPYEAADGQPPLPQAFPARPDRPGLPSFPQLIFANNPALRDRQGPLLIALHPDDAAARGLTAGDSARIYNERGAFEAEVEISDAVRPGVVASSKGYWPKMLRQAANVNATVDERDSDMGGGAVFHDNRVEIVKS